jgi:hypothetical protein
MGDANSWLNPGKILNSDTANPFNCPTNNSIGNTCSFTFLYTISLQQTASSCIMPVSVTMLNYTVVTNEDGNANVIGQDDSLGNGTKGRGGALTPGEGGDPCYNTYDKTLCKLMQVETARSNWKKIMTFLNIFVNFEQFIFSAILLLFYIIEIMAIGYMMIDFVPSMFNQIEKTIADLLMLPGEVK